MIKKLLKFTAISITCLTITQICYASSDGISVILNGSKLDFEVKPQIINGSTYVPMRTIFEKLGATVSWDDSTKTVTGIKEDTTVKLKIGENKVTVNNKDIALNSGATIINGRTLVPVRAVAESFDCTVDWDESINTANIYTVKQPQNVSKNNYYINSQIPTYTSITGVKLKGSYTESDYDLYLYPYNHENDLKNITAYSNNLFHLGFNVIDKKNEGTTLTYIYSHILTDNTIEALYLNVDLDYNLLTIGVIPSYMNEISSLPNDSKNNLNYYSNTSIPKFENFLNNVTCTNSSSKDYDTYIYTIDSTDATLAGIATYLVTLVEKYDCKLVEEEITQSSRINYYYVQKNQVFGVAVDLKNNKLTVDIVK